MPQPIASHCIPTLRAPTLLLHLKPVNSTQHLSNWLKSCQHQFLFGILLPKLTRNAEPDDTYVAARKDGEDWYILRHTTSEQATTRCHACKFARGPFDP
jgi:hypothetical protein